MASSSSRGGRTGGEDDGHYQSHRLQLFKKSSIKQHNLQKRGAPITRNVIFTTQAPAAIGPYSQAIATKDLLFVSGQLPIDPSTGKMVDGDIGTKTQQILKNVAAIAKEAGTDLTKTLKTTIFLTDLGDFQAVNSAYGSFFPEAPPARSTVQVAALPLGSNIEIECILARQK